jgi:glycosyltransferase involved in cell wall biosynthesis
VGDIRRKPDMRIKYGSFFEAISRQMDLLEVYDASLTGIDRYWVAMQSFSPSISRWKGRYFKNIPAFKLRSKMASRHFHEWKGRADVILQLGVLFDSTSNNVDLPVVLYTDNTTMISARHPDPARHPFSKKELMEWLELETGVYQRAAHIHVRAEIVKRSLMQDYHIQPERISVIGAGVNSKVLPVLPHRSERSDFTALFIGTDFLRKGGDLALLAFARLHKLHPQTRLVLVTKDPIPARFPLEGVQVLAPIWERPVLESLYAQADVFMLPSRMETWGDVLLEAMSFGLPCIGVSGQAMEDIILQEKTGLLVAPEDVDQLAEALIRLFEQPDLRQNMGQAGRRLVENEFTWDRVAERIFPILWAVTRQNPVSDRLPSLERISI